MKKATDLLGLLGGIERWATFFRRRTAALFNQDSYMAVEMELAFRNYNFAKDSRTPHKAIAIWNDRFYRLVKYDFERAHGRGEEWLREEFFERLSLDSGAIVLPRRRWSKIIDLYIEREGSRLVPRVHPVSNQQLIVSGHETMSEDLETNVENGASLNRAISESESESEFDYDSNSTGRVIWKVPHSILEFLYQPLQDRLDCTAERFYAVFSDRRGEPIPVPDRLTSSLRNRSRRRTDLDTPVLWKGDKLELTVIFWKIAPCLDSDRAAVLKHFVDENGCPFVESKPKDLESKSKRLESEVRQAINRVLKALERLDTTSG